MKNVICADCDRKGADLMACGCDIGMLTSPVVDKDVIRNTNGLCHICWATMTEDDTKYGDVCGRCGRYE